MAAEDLSYLSGEDLIGSLLSTNKVLIPLAISPYGRWGDMFHAFLFSPDTIKHPLSFRDHTTNAV